MQNVKNKAKMYPILQFNNIRVVIFTIAQKIALKKMRFSGANLSLKEEPE